MRPNERDQVAWLLTECDLLQKEIAAGVSNVTLKARVAGMRGTLNCMRQSDQRKSMKRPRRAA